jgi:hypothetical protein
VLSLALCSLSRPSHLATSGNFCEDVVDGMRSRPFFRLEAVLNICVVLFLSLLVYTPNLVSRTCTRL